MDLTSIREIRVESSGRDFTVWLPIRPLGKIRWFGLLGVGFSALWVSTSGKGLLEMLSEVSTSHQKGISWAMIVFLAGFTLVGCTPGFYGLLTICGHCKIRWRNGRLSVSELIGPFGRRRRMPKVTIEKFTVRAGVKNDGKLATSGPMANLAVLVAEFATGKSLVISIGYPRDWLEAIAAELSRRVQTSQTAPPQVEVIDEREAPPELQDFPKQPADSKIVIQRQSTGLTLEIPPAGLRKGSKGLFGFACFWCLFMTVFTWLTVFKIPRAAPVWLPFFTFSVCFWAIGISLMALAINMGKRRATIKAGKSEMTIIQTGLFGEKRCAFRRAEIAAIRADASGMAVNEVPINELQIHRLKGKKVGLFAGHDDDELRWMATELRNILGVPAQTPDPSEKLR